jgi:GT2 family glycosyltransferase
MQDDPSGGNAIESGAIESGAIESGAIESGASKGGAIEDGAIGIVAIGRNEGERLRRCLASLSGHGRTVVYVDSGSTDGSQALARATGAALVELDMSAPFTAARARNAGFERLLELNPDAQLVQFIDADCVLRPEWIPVGARVLRERSDVGVVCGRRRERAPQSSIYNRLCDLEWDTPIGEARACGGDALMRVAALRRVAGYDPSMIAGEEPDLCLRLSRIGFRILRLDVEMTLHDAAMTRWTQWWQRALRTGHTTAELLAKYGPAPEHRRLRRALSALSWSVGMPLCFLALAWTLRDRHPIAVAVALALPLLVYLLQYVRVSNRWRRAGRNRVDARAYAAACLFAKWPETWGMLLYVVHRSLGQRARWIEYKDGPRGLGTERGACPVR